MQSLSIAFCNASRGKNCSCTYVCVIFCILLLFVNIPYFRIRSQLTKYFLCIFSKTGALCQPLEVYGPQDSRKKSLKGTSIYSTTAPDFDPCACF